MLIYAISWLFEENRLAALFAYACVLSELAVILSREETRAPKGLAQGSRYHGKMASSLDFQS